MTTTDSPDIGAGPDEPDTEPAETSQSQASEEQTASNDTETTDDAPATTPTAPATTPTAPSDVAEQPRPWRKRLFRAVILVVMAAVAVAAAVLAWPVLNDRVLQPVAVNTEDTAAVQAELDVALERLAGLEDEVATLEGEVAAIDGDLGSLSGQIDTLTGRIDDVDTQLDDLADLPATIEAADAELGDRLLEVKAMELLSRARLFLYQANYGLAAEDVASARAVLADLSGTDPARTLAVERLGVVLSALPDRPVAASADLDIAWQALLGEVPALLPLGSTSPAAGNPTTVPGVTTIPGATTVPETSTTQP